jgi:hypothetical protein
MQNNVMLVPNQLTIDHKIHPCTHSSPCIWASSTRAVILPTDHKMPHKHTQVRACGHLTYSSIESVCNIGAGVDSRQFRLTDSTSPRKPQTTVSPRKDYRCMVQHLPANISDNHPGQISRAIYGVPGNKRNTHTSLQRMQAPLVHPEQQALTMGEY